MASDLSKYTGNRLARWFAGEEMPPPPDALWVGLFNGDPKTTGVEVTTNVRAAGRVEAPFTAPAESDTVNTMQSTADVDFGDSAAQVQVSHFGYFDAQNAGKPLASKPLTGGAITIPINTSVKFLAGDLGFALGS